MLNSELNQLQVPVAVKLVNKTDDIMKWIDCDEK